MALFDIALQVLVVAFVLNAVSVLVVLGPRTLSGALQRAKANVQTLRSWVVALGAVLVANSIIRDIGVDLSWLIGLNVTWYIHAVEGQLVADLQSAAFPALTAYFSSVYVYGYVFLLTFPVIAYAVYDSYEPLQAVIVAYVTNYGVGLVCYVVFLAYGPRNFMPELVEPLLYANWPQSQVLTSEVNTNTNVFPSLHTSLSATVALLALRYHSIYDRWTPVAWLLAASITVSTIYLGIHWFVDVAAGLALAVLSVTVAIRVTGVVNTDRSPMRSIRRS